MIPTQIPKKLSFEGAYATNTAWVNLLRDLGNELLARGRYLDRVARGDYPEEAAREAYVALRNLRDRTTGIVGYDVSVNAPVTFSAAFELFADEWGAASARITQYAGRYSDQAWEARTDMLERREDDILRMSQPPVEYTPRELPPLPLPTEEGLSVESAVVIGVLGVGALFGLYYLMTRKKS